eukprot:scaffold6881_cov126-Cylindrotheca_fusiformis.AAC.3
MQIVSLLHLISFFLATIPRPEAFVLRCHKYYSRGNRLQSSNDVLPDWSSRRTKRIVFIRHGRTYMNDFIGGINYGSPNFTDVFPEANEDKYKDSPLTRNGIDQAKQLDSMLIALCNGEENARQAAKKRLSLSDQDATFLLGLELVLVSPLTRALQTLEIGLYQTIRDRKVPVMALPLATERVYLISDIGKAQNELKEAYKYVDFDTAFPRGQMKPWYFTPSDELAENYVEWRPSGEGQVYACLGEPQDYFDRRMSELYSFLDGRPESTIALVCHAGVIDWFVRDIFENCELRVVKFDDLKPRNLVDFKKEATV